MKMMKTLIEDDADDQMKGVDEKDEFLQRTCEVDQRD